MFGLGIIYKTKERREESRNLLELFFVEGELTMKEKVKDIEDYLKLNTRIAVGIKRADYSGVYDSRVEDIEKKHILISHPTDNGVPIPMLPGTKVSVEYATNEGRFHFETEVIDRHSEGSLSLIKITIPENITKNQLREFFRVSTNLKGKAKIFYSKVPDPNMKIPHKKVPCKVVDMSGGGGKLITEVFFEKGQVFGLDLSEEIEGTEDLKCTCIRSKRIQEKSEVSFKFNFTKESERNPIIKYVFKRQIELKQIMG
jgi:c-di-GMP-binding flagellar brake protein YcgR